jgi:glutathione S-transferase
MTIQLTAFRWVPPFAQGFVKDLRVRWALEEAGLPYEAVLVDRQILDSESHRRWQPFGQVPAYKDGELELFESGAIVLAIAAKSTALSPADEAGRARVTAWVIAALNSIEPYAQFVIHTDSLADTGPGHAVFARFQSLLNDRLTALSTWLADKHYLEDRFTACDLIMTTVLRELTSDGLLARFPNLDAYRERCEARPAFRRAFEAQMKNFSDKPAQ